METDRGFSAKPPFLLPSAGGTTARDGRGWRRCAGGGEVALGADGVGEGVPVQGDSIPPDLVARGGEDKRSGGGEPKPRELGVARRRGVNPAVEAANGGAKGRSSCAGTRRTRRRRSGGAEMARGWLSTVARSLTRAAMLASRGEARKGRSGGHVWCVGCARLRRSRLWWSGYEEGTGRWRATAVNRRAQFAPRTSRTASGGSIYPTGRGKVRRLRAPGTRGRGAGDGGGLG